MSKAQFNPCIIHLTDEQYRKVIDIAQEDIDNKWKGKIRNKIKELEEELQYDITKNEARLQIKLLEEILEEK